MKGKKGLADVILEKAVLSPVHGMTARQVAQQMGHNENSIQSALRSLVNMGHVLRQPPMDGKSSVYTLCQIHWIHSTKISEQPARVFGAGNWVCRD